MYLRMEASAIKTCLPKQSSAKIACHSMTRAHKCPGPDLFMEKYAFSWTKYRACLALEQWPNFELCCRRQVSGNSLGQRVASHSSHSVHTVHSSAEAEASQAMSRHLMCIAPLTPLIHRNIQNEDVDRHKRFQHCHNKATDVTTIRLLLLNIQTGCCRCPSR